MLCITKSNQNYSFFTIELSRYNRRHEQGNETILRFTTLFHFFPTTVAQTSKVYQLYPYKKYVLYVSVLARKVWLETAKSSHSQHIVSTQYQTFYTLFRGKDYKFDNVDMAVQIVIKK